MSAAFSIGQMNQLSDALELAGFTPDEVTKLRNFPQLQDLRRVINGHAQITIVKHIIDMDAATFLPDGWKVEGHAKQGQLEWTPEKVALYYSEHQQGDRWIKGDELHKELQTKPVFNANLLEWYLAHKELIPESWKGKAICFWGTVYRNSDGGLYVRYLYWDGESWRWGYFWLGLGFFSDRPAAVAGK